MNGTRENHNSINTDEDMNNIQVGIFIEPQVMCGKGEPSAQNISRSAWGSLCLKRCLGVYFVYYKPVVLLFLRSKNGVAG